MTTFEDFQRAFAEGAAMVRPDPSIPLLATLAAILTRCDDLDAMVSSDGVLDRNQIRIDSARIRQKAEEARLIVLGRTA